MLLLSHPIPLPLGLGNGEGQNPKISPALRRLPKEERTPPSRVINLILNVRKLPDTKDRIQGRLCKKRPGPERMEKVFDSFAVP